MRSLIMIGLLAAAAIAATPKHHQLDGYSFDHYVSDFRRGYKKGTSEYIMRQDIFNENLAVIKKHNSDLTQSYKKGVNAFTDVTQDEFRKYNRYEKAKNMPKPSQVHTANPTDTVPSVLDYRLNNNPRILSDIKNQGMCGNCWAHSSTESVESYFAMKTGLLNVLSTQQITSCTTFMDGCGGGDAVAGWIYVNSTSGLTSEWAYPFVDIFVPEMSKKVTAKCKNITTEFKPFGWFNELIEVGILGYGAVSPANDAKAALSGLANVGPMSISVAALGWKDYETGVYQNNGNSTDDWQIDHAVQMVGYGSDTTSNKNYWIVRNSWGTLWGEAGYIKLDRPATEPCNAFQNVCGTSGCLNGLNYPQVWEQKHKDF